MKTITHILITHALFLVLFGGAALALAEENTSAQPQMPEIGQSLGEQQQQREAIQTEPQTTREERRAELQTRAQERITNLAANVSNRQEAVIARMQDIIDRIETRIEKLQGLGVDTNEAEVTLASAQESVDAASAEIANIDERVAEMVGSEDARTAWAKTKAIYMIIHEHLKSTRESLRATITALKTAVQAEELGHGVSEAVQNKPDTVDTPDENTQAVEN